MSTFWLFRDSLWLGTTKESGSTATLLVLLYIPGNCGYLINFLNVLPVALPDAKTTSYPTNRMSEKPLH